MSSPASPAVAKGQERLRFLDALRGIAATAVVAYHLYVFSGLSERLATVFPAPLRWFCLYGWAGVDVFFVLSGFVIGLGVTRRPIDGPFVARFTVRRSLRLDPPYWGALVVAVVLRWVAAAFLHDPAPPPSAGVVVANALYLQNIVGVPNVASQFWTLTYEVQFYLVLVLVTGACQRITRATRGDEWTRRAGSLLVIAPLAIASWSLLATQAHAHGFFIDLWYAFFLGAVTEAALGKRTPVAVWLAVVALTAAAALIGHEVRAAFSIGTATIIFVVGRLGGLASWLAFRPVQYLGRISYSLYLTHFTASSLAKFGGHRATSTAAAVGWFALALAASIVVADVFYRLVEGPSLRVAHDKRAFEWIAARVRTLRAARVRAPDRG